MERSDFFMSLELGTKKGTTDVYEIPTERRLQNTVIYGAIGSGKTRSMLLSMAVKQFEDTSSGATFICGRGEESWLLDRLAHKMNREVIFLHPAVDKGTKDYLETEYRTGLEIQKHLIDYAQAIEEKKIIIVDFDFANYRRYAQNGLTKLLYHIQRSITHNTEDSPHFIYIDDAENSLPYIRELISYGKNNAVGTTLLLSSYSLIEAQSRELAYFLNAKCSTTILMNHLSYEDFNYFERRLNKMDKLTDFRKRAGDDVVVEAIRNGVVSVDNVIITSPPQRLITEVEDEVDVEQDKLAIRRRPRVRNILHEVTQTSYNVETGFEKPIGESRVFLDEDDFLNNL